MGRGSTKRVAAAGALTAIAVMSLVLSRALPMQAGVAAVASLFVAAAMLECDVMCAVGVWVATSVMAAILLPGAPGTWLFAAFFGYYPIVKIIAERKFEKKIAWIVKLAIFAVAFTLLWTVARQALTVGISSKLEGMHTALVAAICTAVFAVFDVGYTRLVEVYTMRVRGRR